MKGYSHKTSKDRMFRIVTVIIGIAINVLLSYVLYKSGLPIYLDTLGTIWVSMVAGIFPGIVTGVLTDTLCLAFNENAIYFAFVNAIIAMYGAWFARNRNIKQVKDCLIFVMMMGIILGLVSSFTQWVLLGGPQNQSTILILEKLGVSQEYARFALFVIIEIMFGTFGSAISLTIVRLVLSVFPEDLRVRIKNGGWRQKPLTSNEITRMDSLSDKINFSMRNRIAITFVLVSLAVSSTLGFIGIRQYFSNAIKEKTENAYHAAEFASYVVNPEMIDEYIRDGKDAPGYLETEELLYHIRDNAPGVRYLHISKVDKDVLISVFDLDEKKEYEARTDLELLKAKEPGKFVPLYEDFVPYHEQLLKGERIPVIEMKSPTNWTATVSLPIMDEEGNCACYAFADVSIDYIADYMQDFMLRVILSLLGFLILIISYAIWTTGIHITYPINSIVAMVEEFAAAGGEQSLLDNAVRSMRRIDIRTDDEVEMLYHTICNMASDQTENMRSLRRFSDSTLKMQDGLIITMADLVENRDSDTGAHIQKTAAYVKIIVEGLQKKGYYAGKITPKFISDVVRSAPLHDIGKINIPDEILKKPGKLTDEEYEIIKTHTTAGKNIIEKTITRVGGESYLKEARNMAAFHHERWDGKGYPEGLYGEVIPLSARIMALADVFDALSSPRVYKPAFPIDKVVDMLQEGAGTQFDPKCVEVFLESMPEVRVILRKYNEGVTP
ncbi:HD-GYP domain-containing protein [Oribacterium sp. FC2011]|uniref:HD-GYP domain-containing protein n=1 Tax=Oribacterium sp. FC2011 TaxID=1408311 RepID=UPI0004E19902|nr:HD domain-containing phosphohydrolase [Oribacterium sp. FC2011]